MSFGIQMPASTVRWLLVGPPGPEVDMLVATLIGSGVAVEAVKPRSVYRLNPAALPDHGQTMLGSLAEQLNGMDGFSLAVEQAPTDVIVLAHRVAPAFPYRRQVTVHGQGTALGFVARAVDRSMDVRAVGLLRWSVAARSAEVVAWLSEIWARPTDQVLEMLGLTPESLAAEDRPPASVSVVLPDRRIESVITRDEAGQIVDFTQTETTV